MTSNKPKMPQAGTWEHSIVHVLRQRPHREASFSTLCEEVEKLRRMLVLPLHPALEETVFRTLQQSLLIREVRPRVWKLECDMS